MTFLRSALAPVSRPSTYRRWVHLVLGGALFLPIALAVLVATSLLVQGATSQPPAGLGSGGAVGPIDGVAIVLAAVLGGLLAFVPTIASQQLALARALLGGPLAARPVPVSMTWARRRRAAVWTSSHLLVGMAVSLATMILLTEAALLAMAPFAAASPAPPGPMLLGGVDGATTGWAGPALGVVVVLLLIHGVALVGTAAARLAPVLLGPSAADRLAAAQARADDLSRRNRLATELHDAIGHASSVVSLQAAAAARLLDRDPVFARDALEAIADQARTATAELDRVLGLIGDEPEPGAVEPLRNLVDLPQLVEAARATGTDLRVRREGSLEDIAPALSRELYRLCQEAITNALRHGDRGAPIELRLQRDADRLELWATNQVVGRRTARTGGRGLAGMRDRVHLLGGEFDAGADGDRWQLRVQVPLTANPARATSDRAAR